nr:amidophosphoribosyltransferase [Calditrichia bacterium]
MCGIAAYYSRNEENAAASVVTELYAQQHRGQESGGIAASNGREITVRKAMGYIKEGISGEDLKRLSGRLAIGHVRYPTRGTSDLAMTQPYVIETLSGPIYAIASNGDIVNY